ncbi:bifunctional hydroxymethylpyrimidine kinase/phosphomethylpyrimidine kinase [Actinoplanes sp. LDG1-06]|uniref:Bifunctional hydroxymethylpyrimidine kinase/phosphomethylpyrimidine kinase n=1 Tax=Paractinoplanes ovalisporus TaxID=2810368 RepID=A0ABS2AD60_9ACTN|nr:PfkB family carbohydrate kinase [Actinoplanes ovalisporus]MBM2617771.1 bifunctional hydroxymethylpyrimidine kinase/phosphomethylpyrimidine kinase [Actinoplanes ovalisporus]
MIVVGDLVTDVLVAHSGPIELGSDTAAAITVGGGGQAANTAAWLAHTGRPVTLVAAVGDDPAGRERVAELTAADVRCAVSVHSGVATGSIVVLAGPEERTMITDRGASLRLDPADVRAAVLAADGGHLHLSGYPLLHEGSRAAGLAALSAAAERGMTTSVDAASAAPLRSVGASAFLTWVRGVDLLLCNADEADELAGAGSAAEQAGRLTAHVRHVVVKQGAAGATWASRDGAVHSVAPERVPMKDPTGAGDAFAAGLLAAWCAGESPAAALKAGAALGAEAVSLIGARPSVA